MNLYVLVFVITSVLAMGLRQVQARLMVEDRDWHPSHRRLPLGRGRYSLWRR